MGKVKMTIECEEEQIRLIQDALEEFLRLRIGQADKLAEDIAFDGYNDEESKEKFYERLLNKKWLRESIENALKICSYESTGKTYVPKSGRARTAEDLYVGIRYSRYCDLFTPEQQETFKHTVFINTPLGIGEYPVAKIKIERISEV